LTIWINDFDDITVDLRISSDSSQEFLVNTFFFKYLYFGETFTLLHSKAQYCTFCSPAIPENK